MIVSEILEKKLYSKCVYVVFFLAEATKQSRYSNSDDWWSLADLHIAGRNCLNLWRLMRHEVTENALAIFRIAQVSDFFYVLSLI